MQKFGQIQCMFLIAESRVLAYVLDMESVSVVVCFYDQNN